ncbi:MAG: hypothetical protein G01um101413_450 [Parcubacteria group bacterium Gr01-1014_13]|nr:MAG: hypothetical protein G01um101413_450 [Parcubacteria group bacterium Gr01-1014_13]
MPNNHCDAWWDLIFDNNNRGKIYDQFNRERAELIEHLEHCDICKNVIGQIEPLSTFMDIDELASLTPEEFAILIRELYSNARGLVFEDDAVNMDHD